VTPAPVALLRLCSGTVGSSWRRASLLQNLPRKQSVPAGCRAGCRAARCGHRTAMRSRTRAAGGRREPGRALGVTRRRRMEPRDAAFRNNPASDSRQIAAGGPGLAQTGREEANGLGRGSRVLVVPGLGGPGSWWSRVLAVPGLGGPGSWRSPLSSPKPPRGRSVRLRRTTLSLYWARDRMTSYLHKVLTPCRPPEGPGPLQTSWTTTDLMDHYRPPGPLQTSWTTTDLLDHYRPPGPPQTSWTTTDLLDHYRPPGPLQTSWTTTDLLDHHRPPGPLQTSWTTQSSWTTTDLLDHYRPPGPHRPPGPLQTSWTTTKTRCRRPVVSADA